MSRQPIGSIADHFSQLHDARVERTKFHPLLNLLFFAISAVICGADDWVEVEAFGKAKRKWLKRFLPLSHCIPSHDTFARIFARLDREQFRKAFLEWVPAVSELTQGQVIAIDGKTLRRSHDRRQGKQAIYMISAWATANRLVLAAQKHCGIENGLHWLLDIAFAEDASRVRKDHGPVNFVVLRHIALNLLKQEGTEKVSIPAKRLKSGWDEEYLLRVFGIWTRLPW